uniref:Multiple PDZ domain protein-like n=1 Tax=Cynoglossus semilaevis TaxID=244447 RepID=A0A3P8V6M0_CYNSE
MCSGNVHSAAGTLEKDPAASGLGITLTGNNDGSRARTSVFVADIDPQGVADSDGRLLLGDQIVSINGVDARAASLEQAQKLLQVSGENVTLPLGQSATRLKVFILFFLISTYNNHVLHLRVKPAAPYVPQLPPLPPPCPNSLY